MFADRAAASASLSGSPAPSIARMLVHGTEPRTCHQ